MPNLNFYTLEQLVAASPKAVVRLVREKAAKERRDIKNTDFFLTYKTKNGVADAKLTQLALRELDNFKDLDKFDRNSIRFELEKASKNFDYNNQSHNKNYLSAFSAESDDLLNDISGFGYVEPEPEVIKNQIEEAPKNFYSSPQELLVAEFLERSKDSQFVTNKQMLANPEFKTQLLHLSQTPEGHDILNTAILATQTNNSSELMKMSMRMPDYSLGVIDPDFKKLPNFRALGIDRDAGKPTLDEIEYAKGQLRNDGTPVTVDDFFSAGALLVNIDIIPQLMAFIPPVEIGRLGAILETRAKKSDLNHSREVMSGPFTVVNPAIGQDADCKMHVDHPLLGKQPYTALIARLIYPEMEHNLQQKAAVESAKRGQLQNLSIAFSYNSLSCATCGEMLLLREIVQDDNIIGFKVDPECNMDLCCDRDEDNRLYRLPAILRTPVGDDGGYAYQNVSITDTTADGTLTINPINKKMLNTGKGSTLLISMQSYYSYWMGGLMTWCNLHGLNGAYQKDGRRTIAQFTQMRSLINVAHVDAGAVNDSRIILSVDCKY